MKKIYYKTLFLASASLIMYLALTSDEFSLIEGTYEDKINHFFAFFTLSLLLNRASSSTQARLRNVIALLLFGSLIEFVQYFVPYRSSSFYDIVADLGGILLFQLSLSLYRYTKENLSKPLPLS